MVTRTIGDGGPDGPAEQHQTDTVADAENPGSTRVRLALLDDHELLLDSMSSWITTNATDFDLVVSAGTWMDLVTSTAFPTQLVIMDLQLREPISIEARIRTCRAAGATVIVLSAVDDDRDRERALRAGAAAYLVKSSPMREVLDRARSVMGVGGTGDTTTQWRPLPIGAPTLVRPKLSSGELEALRLYVAGATTGDVAVKMNVQYETVKTYLRRVREKYAKVGRPASKKSDLIRRAAEDGLLK
ncbi:response regulator transcription factor [Microbacteriaceae bacterium VKM Ac-2855]|nr:response regulator transcription factor [Microbacteriaceae bacterium VKM Ac-2855]